MTHALHTVYLSNPKLQIFHVPRSTQNPPTLYNHALHMLGKNLSFVFAYEKKQGRGGM